MQAIQQSVAEHGFGVKVQTLAEDVGISDRHLNRLLLNYTGYSPKMFLQVQRFCQVKQQLQTAPPQHLTDVAYQMGYHDQSHFIREFKAFSQQTPRQYLKSINKWFDEDYQYTGIFDEG